MEESQFMKPLELVELEENDHCTSIRIACEQSISMTCLCFFTKASSLGGLGFCIKLLFTSGSWKVLSRNFKEEKHTTQKAP